MNRKVAVSCMLLIVVVISVNCTKFYAIRTYSVMVINCIIFVLCFWRPGAEW